MVEFLAIPKLGLTMTDCTLVDWMKDDGDRVEPGEILYAIETDKITSDVEAGAPGFLKRFEAVNKTLMVGDVIGGIYPTKAEALAATAGETAPSREAGRIAAPDGKNDAAAMSADGVQADLPASVGENDAHRKRVSPLARRIAANAGIDPASLAGSGVQGAVLRRDVDAEIRKRASAEVGRAPVPPAPASSDLRVEATRRPLGGMRRAIARSMMQSLQTTAQMTGFARVDMAEVVSLRKSCLAAEVELGVRISFTDIALKAAAVVLAGMPEINASIIGDEIVTWPDVNMGLAVALDDGLIVPVIHNADRKTLVEIAHERIDLAARARAGRLSREDMEGGTFSLSNFGSYGGDFETPVLNPPQSALLGIGGITDEAVVRDGQIVARPMMMLSMTFDHRLIDGAVAGRFRSRLRTILENPYSMMARMR
jgi:pyruvate dehydrogenase E2 component (dihydrolipoamide acetyltransferase)